MGVVEVCLRLKAFYEKSLNMEYSKDYVNIDAITSDKDVEQIIKLLELIIGAAVQSERKEFIVAQILKLSETDQTQLMHLMEQLTVTKEDEVDDNHEQNFPEELIEVQDGLAISIAELKAMEDKALNQEAEIEELKEDNQKLAENNTSLQDKIRSLEAELKRRLHRTQREMRRSSKSTHSKYRHSKCSCWKRRRPCSKLVRPWLTILMNPKRPFKTLL
eukprot:TRINITY_DN15600_c0_g1_i1.p1 TRINITY_DN15600_c0_g1~~TRINITY_DN15600_c0_g1_i1.p1  ORF type:complete len:218 (-),score=31.25 TRINITY_DN15600_c0_g1_i1:306-959(-)